MLHEIHDHINQEIRQNTRTDTIFIITAMVFNFIMLIMNSSLAGSASYGFRQQGVNTSLIILVINLIITIVVNGIATAGLVTGRGTRKTLMDGLLKMYEDENVLQYYHKSLMTNYTSRYTMFIGIIAILAVASVLIPLVILWAG